MDLENPGNPEKFLRNSIDLLRFCEIFKIEVCGRCILSVGGGGGPPPGRRMYGRTVFTRQWQFQPLDFQLTDSIE